MIWNKGANLVNAAISYHIYNVTRLSIFFYQKIIATFVVYEFENLVLLGNGVGWF